MGSAFALLSFADQRDPDVVYLGTRTGSLLLKEPAEMQSYRTLFDHLRATASAVRPSLELISETIRSL